MSCETEPANVASRVTEEKVVGVAGVGAEFRATKPGESYTVYYLTDRGTIFAFPTNILKPEILLDEGKYGSFYVQVSSKGRDGDAFNVLIEPPGGRHYDVRPITDEERKYLRKREEHPERIGW